MSMNHFIKQLFTIKDPNIQIHSFEETFYKEKKAIVIEGTLVCTYRRCPCCKGSAKQIVKNGKKGSMILLNRSGNKRTYLRLKKQRYFCQACKKYFTARTSFVAPFCFISKQVYYKILEELTERQSMKAISKHCDVSVMTVQQTLSALSSDVRQNLEYLAQCLLFDEFRSLSPWHGKFSFSCMDGETGKLFASRHKKDLVAFSCVFLSKRDWVCVTS